jgi:hypothetical protein
LNAYSLPNATITIKKRNKKRTLPFLIEEKEEPLVKFAFNILYNYTYRDAKKTGGVVK